MERLSRDINRLENSVARYIYIKYIQAVDTVPVVDVAIVDAGGDDAGDGASSSEDEDKDEEEEEKEKAVGKGTRKGKSVEKVKAKAARPKVLDKAAYEVYRKNIFYHSRSCFVLNQDDLIREDIRIMNLADEAYDESPDGFKMSDYELPPDVLRCSFIRKHHHRYYRCRNAIMNKDSDICKKHENRDNIYYDNYNDILERLGF